MQRLKDFVRSTESRESWTMYCKICVISIFLSGRRFPPLARFPTPASWPHFCKSLRTQLQVTRLLEQTTEAKRRVDDSDRLESTSPSLLAKRLQPTVHLSIPRTTSENHLHSCNPGSSIMCDSISEAVLAWFSPTASPSYISDTRRQSDNLP